MKLTNKYTCIFLGTDPHTFHVYGGQYGTWCMGHACVCMCKVPHIAGDLPYITSYSIGTGVLTFFAIFPNNILYIFFHALSGRIGKVVASHAEVAR